MENNFEQGSNLYWTKTDSKKYGIKLYNNKNADITFIWETENEEFNERFSKIIKEYFCKKNGSVSIDKIFKGKLESSLIFKDFKVKEEENE